MPGPYDNWDDITPGRSSKKTPQSSSPYDDWEDITPKRELNNDFGAGYALPSLQDIYSTALKIPGQLIETGVGALDFIGAPFRAAAPDDIPSLGKHLRETTSYNPEQWEKEISEKEDSERLSNARQELGQDAGFVDTFNHYWRNPGLAALDVESSAVPMYIGGALGRGVKAVTGLGPLISGAIGEGGLTAAQQTADITRDKGDFDPKDFLPVAASAATTAAISGAGGKLANKLGLPDVEQMLADPTRKGTRRILPLLGSGVIEGFLEEAPQSYQEKVATNYATGKPLTQGAGQAAASGAVSGFAMGGGMPMILGNHDKPASNRYEGTNETDELFDHDTEQVGSTFEVPKEHVTEDFVKGMRDNGYILERQLPSGNTLFKRVNSSDDNTGGGDGGTPIPPPLPNQPDPAGEAVINTPISGASGVLSSILSDSDPNISTEANVARFEQLVNSTTNPTELAGMLQLVQMHPRQDALTKSLANVIAHRLNAIQNINNYQEDPNLNQGEGDPLQAGSVPYIDPNREVTQPTEPPGDLYPSGENFPIKPGFPPSLQIPADQSVPTNDVEGLRVQNGTNVVQGPFGQQQQTEWDPKNPYTRTLNIPVAQLNPQSEAELQQDGYVKVSQDENISTWLHNTHPSAVEEAARFGQPNVAEKPNNLSIWQQAVADNPRTESGVEDIRQQQVLSGPISDATEGPGSPGWQENITSSTGDIERALNSAGPIVSTQDMAPVTNVAQFPEQPSGELRDAHKDLMGQVQTRAAELQQAASELRQTYPNATGEQIHNVLTIQNNISRARTKGRDASVQEALLARVVSALQTQEANAPKSGPTGIVPPTTPATTPAKQTVIIGKNQLTPKVLDNLNRSGYVEVGKTSDGSSRFEKEVVQGPSVTVHSPKADDLQRQVDAFERQGQPDKAYRALTADSPHARLKKGETWKGRAEKEIARLRLLENPPSIDAPAGEATITPESSLRHPTAQQWMARVKELDAAGAPDIKYRDITSSLSRMTLKKGDTWRNVVLGAIEYFESRVGPDAGSAMIKPFDPRIGSGVGQSFEKALRDATDEDLVRMEEQMVGDVDKARAHLERVRNISNMSGVAKRRVVFAEGKLTTIQLEQEIRAREVARELQFANDDERAFVRQYTADNIAEARGNYEDITPDREKRYEVYDEDGNLIHKTYDYDEAHRLADQENGYVNDTDNNVSRMRVPGINPKTGRPNIVMGGADPAVLDMLGTSLYNRDSIATSVKELGQNAVDERKISGNKEPIRVVFSEYTEIPGQRSPTGAKVYGKAIIVKDFGRGMTPEQLYTIFTDVGKSGKRNEATASGGFGFAKAAPMLGGLHVQVESIVNENGKLVSYEFEGDPKQMKDQAVGVPLHRTEVTQKGAKTGFEVTVIFPETKQLAAAKRLWKTTIENSPGMDNIQSFNSGSSIDWDDDINEFLDNGTVINDYNKKNVIEHKSLPTPSLVNTINLPEADIQVRFDLDDKERQDATIVVLNNGLFALATDYSYGRTPLPNVPEKIVLDINALVPEGHDAYPFGLNREDMDDEFKAKILKWIDDNIKNPAQTAKIGEIQKLFDDLQPASPHHQHVLHDSGDRMTAKEKAEFNNSPHVREVAAIMGKMLDELRFHFSHAQNNAVGDTVAFGFMQADSKSGGLNIPNPSITGWRNRKEFKILVNLMGLIQDASSPGIAAEKIAHVILHEFNHNRARSEGADFTWKLLETDSTYTTGRRADIVEEIYAAITGPHGDYAPGIRKLLQSYQDARGRPDTTVDTLSRQRAIEWSREPEGQKGVPSDGERDGKKATPRAIEVLRKALPVVDNFEKTRFILPDGTRLGFDPKKPQYHDEQTHALGVRLAEAQEAGIIRFRDHMAEVHGPISGEQATHLADSTWNSESASNNPFIVVDVLKPGGGRVHEVFTENDSPRKIRNWVNNFFTNFEKGWTQAKDGSTTGALFGGMPFKQAWAGVKEATGWGMGGQLPPPPPVVPGQSAQKPVHWVKEALAVPSGLTTTADLSAPWRQGLGQIHTPQFWKAVVPMLKAGFSEQIFNTIDADLRSKIVMLPRRNRATGKVMPSIATEAGLKMFESASSNAPMGQRAQATASRWIEQGIGNGIGSKIWRNTAGVPIRMSNRAYITFLNHLKVNRFQYLMDQSAAMHTEARNTGFARPGFFKQAYTAQEAADLNGYRNKILAKELADFVNTATGQGPLKTHVLPFRQTEVSLESAAGALQHLFFSPGLIASRVRMLNPSTYIMASPQVRMQYMQSALATGVAWMAALALIKGGGGDDVEVNLEDMTSADWMKAKIGDTRMDPGGGFQQFLVAQARMIQGGTTSSSSNQWREFGEGFNAPTQKGNIERFLTNKLNPVTKFAYDLASQSEYNPFHVKDRVAQLFVPLVIQDLIGLYYENPKMLPWMLPVLVGMGTQSYGRGESVGKLVAPENDWLATGGGLEDMVTTEDENF